MKEIEKLNTKMLLECFDQENSIMTVFADMSGDEDLVGFTFKYNDNDIALSGEEVTGNAEEYFHLNKFQLGCLIDFLQRQYDAMNL